jgi:2-polyprenyl-3-methyl-5-hydroxy-6-metoxy-1,4-benzoquinol methylase/tetratricopeptide (TPR) repeat protein
MVKKKRRLPAGQVMPPGQRELIAQGFRALEAGEFERARGLYRGLLVALPQEAALMVELGVFAMQMGDPGNAENLLRLAVTTQPDRAAFRCNLAIVLRNLGKDTEAIEQLQRALILEPGLVEAHLNLGNTLVNVRRFGEAAAAFEHALALRPDYPDALYGLANAQLAMERREEGCASLERAVAIEPAFHQAHASLATARMKSAKDLLERSAPVIPALASEQAEHGLNSIITALHLCPGNPIYWVKFVDCIKVFGVRHPLTGFARDLLARALDHPAIDTNSLVHAVVSLTNTHPATLEIKRLLPPSGAFDGLTWHALGPLVIAALEEPLLLKVLRDAVVPDAFLEHLVGFARSSMLSEALARSEPSLPGPAIAALAHCGFNTEYAGNESPQETARVDVLVDSLRARRASGQIVPPHWYAVYAAYRPLHSLDGAERIARELAGTPFHELAVRQILEPQEEYELRPSIPALTRALSDVSLAVQTQYEANPYPRFIRPVRLLRGGTVRATMQALFPLLELGTVAQVPPRILIAGCGTGLQPIETAQRFRDANVLAVDLSLTSLAYAKRKTHELGLANIEYRQADILELGSLDERFDIIECAGVLHHLEDPIAGWRVLCGLLRPGGLMRIALYSDLARRHVVQARKFIASEGFEVTPDGIRRCRAAILARPDDVQFEKLARSEDFYSMSGCRDLIFNVQEHQFTLPQIGAILDTLALEFLGFELSDPSTAGVYRASFPDDSTLTRLDNWHCFELDHPDAFTRMYQFWVRGRGTATETA